MKEGSSSRSWFDVEYPRTHRMSLLLDANHVPVVLLSDTNNEQRDRLLRFVIVFLLFTFYFSNFVCISCLTFGFYMSCLLHRSQFD